MSKKKKKVTLKFSCIHFKTERKKKKEKRKQTHTLLNESFAQIFILLLFVAFLRSRYFSLFFFLSFKYITVYFIIFDYYFVYVFLFFVIVGVVSVCAYG